VRRALDLAGHAAMPDRIARARARARAHVWTLIEQAPAGFPWLAIAGKTLAGWLVIDMDATLVTARSDKEGAAPTWKKGYGLLTELPGLSSQFRERVPPGTVTVPDHDRTRRSSSDVASLVVAQVGFLQATGGPWDPYRLVDPSGEVVGPVTVYLMDLQAAGRAVATQRSYGMDLLRWFRFCWATGTPWDQATRSEACDFCRWIQIAAKPVSPRWTGRSEAGGEMAADVAVTTPKRRAANRVTGKPAPGGRYAASTAVHCESVLRQFYDFHLEAGSGPMVNPFPLDRRLRWIVRRAKPSRRQMPNLTAYEKKTGWRYSIICTNIPDGGIPGVTGSHHPPGSPGTPASAS
jgi:hypothetical protein